MPIYKTAFIYFSQLHQHFKSLLFHDTNSLLSDMCNVPLIGIMCIVILDRSERKWTHLLLGKSRKIQNKIVRAVHLVETALWNLPAKSKQTHPAHILKGRKAQCTDHRVGALMRSRSGCRIRRICCGLCVPLLCLGRFPWCSIRIQLADHMTDRIHQIPQ